MLVTHGMATISATPWRSPRPTTCRSGHRPVQPDLLTLGMMPNMVPPAHEQGRHDRALPGVKITMVHAEHSSEMVLEGPATGKDTASLSGEPVGFIISSRTASRSITPWRHRPVRRHEDDRRSLQARPPAGADRRPLRDEPWDAAYATKELIKPKMAWPIHYASNPVPQSTPPSSKAALGQTSVQVIDAEPRAKKEF